MCPKPVFPRFFAAAAAAGLGLLAVQPASAAEALRQGRPSLFSPVSAFPGGYLTIGYLTPGYSSMTSAVAPATLNGGATQPFDVGAGYSAPVSVGKVGVFGAYDQRSSVLALQPMAAWNFGASVGYAGFYLRGGVNEAAPVGPLLGLQGVEAGVGYEIGAFDLRMTYLASQGVGFGEREIDSKQWTIGGIYQITPRIRVNADAFYGIAESKGAALSVQSPLTAPPGTGARVGVELRF